MKSLQKLFLIVFYFLFSAFIAADTIPDKPEDVSPLLVGEKIPNVKLSDNQNNVFDLYATLKTKKTILIFYRGGWCPYCIKHLKEINEIEKEIAEAGWQLIAISPDSPENLKMTMEKQKIGFLLLSDADMSFAKQLGIAFKGNYGKMLTEKSGGKNTDQLLPVPAVFFVKEDATIAMEYINPDFKNRINTSLLKSLINHL